MITKEVLEKMKSETHIDACCCAIDCLSDEGVSPYDFGFRLGKFRGREDMLDELLALLDDANISSSNV